MKELADRAALPVADIEFMEDTFRLLAMAIEYVFTDDDESMQERIRAAKKAYKAKYPKKGSRYRYRIKLDFTRPMEAHNTAEFVIVPEGTNASRVTWAMHGPQPYIGKVMSLVFSMDRMVGKDNYVAVLTADHGFSPAPEHSKSIGRNAGRQNTTELLDAVSAALGKRVILHYREHRGLPTSCFGETNYFVTGVRVAE